MRIPIKALKEFADKYGLSHVIVFADEQPKGLQHVSSFGRTIKDCDQAAQFGDMIKDALGWPKNMHAVPNRVKRLQTENTQFRADLAQAYKVLSEAGLHLNAERFEKYESKEMT